MKLPSAAGIRAGNRTITAVGLVAVVGLSLTFLGGQAQAKGKARPAPAPKVDKKDVHACGIVYEKAKERAATAHLREAREMLGKCALPKCGSFLQQECTTLYTQLDADVPTIVPVVTDDTGAPHALVEVRMDGELLTSKLDGHALAVDPGKHVFSFSTDAGVFATQKVMIVQGQRNRAIKALLHNRKGTAGEKAVAVAPDGTVPEGAAGTAEAAGSAGAAAPAGTMAEEAKPPEGESQSDYEVPQATDTDEAAPRPRVTARAVARRQTRSPGVLTYVTGGLGVAGIAGYFLLSTWGKKDNDKLVDCAAAGNLCPVASVDHIHKLYLEANISGAVGLAFLATSAYLYYRSQTSDEVVPVRAASNRPTQTVSLRMFDVKATPSGALATVGGAF